MKESTSLLNFKRFMERDSKFFYFIKASTIRVKPTKDVLRYMKENKIAVWQIMGYDKDGKEIFSDNIRLLK